MRLMLVNALRFGLVPGFDVWRLVPGGWRWESVAFRGAWWWWGRYQVGLAGFLTSEDITSCS